MTITYSQRLTLLHGICLADSYADGATPAANLSDYNAIESAYYLASYITFNAIQLAERQPAQERKDNFDMLGVYQAYALLVFAFLTTPLAQQEVTQDAQDNLRPDYQAAQITIAKTLFAGISDDELIEIIESGLSKVKLISEAESEHWAEFRENLDKITISFVIAGTDDESPHSKEEVLPLFGQLLSQFCEAFEQA